jgi:hypothetical protein
MLAGLVLHIGMMATPLHGVAASPVMLPGTLASAALPQGEPVPHHAAAGARLVAPTSVPAHQPVPDCQLEPAPPPAGPAPALPTGMMTLFGATSSVAPIIPVWPLDQPPRPLQRADSQALLQVFRN